MEKMLLHEKLSLIQKEFKANKSKFNSFGKYNFRSAEDILEALKPYNEKYGVSFIIREELISMYTEDKLPIMKSTATIYDNNGINEISATAIVGVDLNQKGMQVPQQFGSASSYAKKYALGNLLLIDDTKDSDATNTHGNEPKKEQLKLSLEIGGDNFNKAKMFIESGGEIALIEKKYTLTASVRGALLNK